jgi:hypothetical protein
VSQSAALVLLKFCAIAVPLAGSSAQHLRLLFPALNRNPRSWLNWPMRLDLHLGCTPLASIMFCLPIYFLQHVRPRRHPTSLSGHPKICDSTAGLCYIVTHSLLFTAPCDPTSRIKLPLQFHRPQCILQRSIGDFHYSISIPVSPYPPTCAGPLHPHEMHHHTSINAARYSPLYPSNRRFLLISHLSW